MTGTDEMLKPVLSRRGFLKGAGLLLGGSFLAACGARQEDGWQAGDYWRTPTPADIQTGLQPPGTLTPEPEGLGAFLVLSSTLTGFDQLDPQLGSVYLTSLQGNPEFSGGLADLYEQAGLTAASEPPSLESLESAGIFAAEGTRSLADRIIELWYTGIYSQGEEQAVATFVDALAWKAITFTKPPTICGAYGFWAERPKGQY
jgi:hypothetical protein